MLSKPNREDIGGRWVIESGKLRNTAQLQERRVEMSAKNLARARGAAGRRRKEAEIGLTEGATAWRHHFYSMKGGIIETAGQCNGHILDKGRENASQVQSERPIRSKVERAKGRWREDSRPAREAWFYVVRSAHRPNKSSEPLSEPLFPTSEASIS